MSDETKSDTRSAVTETRHFEVSCRRRITESCEVWDELTSHSHGIRSVSAAEARFRKDGWQLHADGTSSCPACLAAWDEGLDLPHQDEDDPVPLDDERDPDGLLPGEDVEVDGIPEPDGFDAAHNEAIRREVDGDGGLGEQLAAGDVS